MNKSKSEKKEVKENKFSKEQLLKSQKYKDKIDLINALLKENERYSLSDVDMIIDIFMKGKVNSMALGGGSFITQNKVLPGAYINFVSAARASSTLSDRGIVALALELDWGPDEEIFTVTQEEFQNNPFRIFGYEYKHEKLKGLRDLFKNAKIAYLYKLNSGVKASNVYGIAKYKGVRGNDIKIVISSNLDEPSKYDVSTYLESSLVDIQIVSTANELVANDYMDFITTATLQATAGAALTGGTNGDTITGTEYQGFLDKIESYSFNALG